MAAPLARPKLWAIDKPFLMRENKNDCEGHRGAGDMSTSNGRLGRPATGRERGTRRSLSRCPTGQAGPEVNNLRTAADAGYRVTAERYACSYAAFDHCLGSGACGWLSTANRFFLRWQEAMDVKIRVMVSGAGGKMGREVLRAVHRAEDMELVGAVDPHHAGSDAGSLAGLGELGVPVSSSLGAALEKGDADCVVDFTTPAAVYGNVIEALQAGKRVVFGTTGLGDHELAEIDRVAREKGLGVIHAPNFAIGAVLMMRFAAEAARFMDQVEIIELHHDQKKDAPSGTAIKTAEMIRQARGNKTSEPLDEVEVVKGVRGGQYRGIRIHSVRLPGLVAHQEVILGQEGQTLTIRHDSLDRVSFMPGVLLAVRKVGRVTGLIYGLERLLFDE